MKTPICVIHGRFQILHNGHVKDLVLPAFDYAERVIIGICNPEKDLTAHDITNPHRSFDISNPFSYWERLSMIKTFLDSQKISHDRYEIIPFPINFPDKIDNYAPQNAAYLLTIYDDWGRKKKLELENQGLNVVIIKEASLSEKPTCGTEIRNLIASNDNVWKQFVPEAVANYLIENDLLKKISSSLNIPAKQNL